MQPRDTDEDREGQRMSQEAIEHATAGTLSMLDGKSTTTTTTITTTPPSRPLT